MCKTAWCARCRIHFRLSTAKTGNKNRPSVPRPQQLVGARRCPPQPRADNEAAARIGDRHGIGHSGILSDNSAYTRIIGVYALVSSAGESDSTRLLLAITSRSNSAAGRRAHHARRRKVVGQKAADPDGYAHRLLGGIKRGGPDIRADCPSRRTRKPPRCPPSARSPAH